MFITTSEIIDLVIMTIAIGYIFSSFIKKPLDYTDPLSYHKNPFIEEIKYGIIVAAPAVVLHELSHKFVAMSFGATATLHAPLFWYGLVILMRLLNFPFIFFVGGYVTHSILPALPSLLVSIAGPLTNIMLWAMFTGVVKYGIVDKKYYRTLLLSAKLNIFLGVFNMIPLPGFDGYHVLMNLIILL